MIINEIFYSLQGEGSLAGVPGVFVRIAGCPLRCKWCDTKYAWDSFAGTKYCIDELAENILGHEVSHIVITGGEPVVADGLGELLEAIKTAATHITIETSGIKFISNLKCDLMSISPKLSNSKPADNKLAAEHEKRRFNLDALQKLIDNYSYQLKFVVDSPADLDEIAQCLEKLDRPNPYKVFLMPQATTTTDYIAKAKMVAEACKQTGFIFSPRLQTLLWNNQRAR